MYNLEVSKPKEAAEVVQNLGSLPDAWTDRYQVAVLCRALWSLDYLQAWEACNSSCDLVKIYVTLLSVTDVCSKMCPVSSMMLDTLDGAWVRNF